MTTQDELEAERRKTRRLITCNVIGVVMVFCLTVFLYLWGAGVLMHGPERTCVVKDFLNKNRLLQMSGLGLPNYYNVSHEQGWHF